MKLLGANTRLLAGAVLLAAMFPAVAVAKTGIVIDSTPEGLPAGDTWMPVIRYIRDDGPVAVSASRHIRVRLTSLTTGTSFTFPAHRLSQIAWQARVVFPAPGRWRYSVEGFGAKLDKQLWDPVTIAPKPHAASTNQAAPRGAAATRPVRQGPSSVGWLIGGLGSLLLLGVLVVLRRRRSRAM
jgi:hypothetical protein